MVNLKKELQALGFFEVMTVLLIIGTSVPLYQIYPVIGKIEIEIDYMTSPIYDLFLPQTRNLQSKSDFLRRLRSKPKTKSCVKLGKRLSQTIEMESTQLSTSHFYSNMIYSTLIKDSVKKGEDCPINYKKCGILDTLDNIMCIKVEEKCPINLILIDDKEESPSNYSQYKFTNIKISNKYLHYTNEAIDNRIVVKFAYYLNIDKNNNEYVVFPYTEESLFINGEFNDFYIKGCEYYKDNIINNTNYNTISSNLFYRPFIGVKSACLPYSSKENYNLQETLTVVKKEKVYKDILYYNNVAGYSTVVMICLLFKIWFYIRKWHIQIILLHIPILIMKILVISFSIIAMTKHEIIDYEVECYDETTNYFNQLLNDNDNTNTFYIVLISSAIFGIILEMFTVFFITRSIKSQQSNDNKVETKKEVNGCGDKENRTTELIMSDTPEK